MQHKQKHMLARPKRKHMRTQRRFALKIKRNPRRSRKRRPKLPFAHRTGRKPNPPLAQPRRQRRYRRRLKQAADRQLNIKARADPTDQTRRKQRATAQRKKVFLNSNPRDPQYLRKQRAQNLLLRRARQTTANPPPILPPRKHTPVQLP